MSRGLADDSEDLAGFVALFAPDAPAAVPEPRTFAPDAPFDGASFVPEAPASFVAGMPASFVASDPADDAPQPAPIVPAALAPSAPATVVLPSSAIGDASGVTPFALAQPQAESRPLTRREARERLRSQDAPRLRSQDAPRAPAPQTPVQNAPQAPAQAPAQEVPSASAPAKPDDASPATPDAPVYPSRRALREARAAAGSPLAASEAAEPVEQPTPRGSALIGGHHGLRNRVAAHEPGARAHHRLHASRTPALIAGAAAIALLPSLMVAAPANAAETISPQQLKATIASNSTLIAQKLRVSSAVASGAVQTENYVAGAIAGIVAAESGPDGARVAIALAGALQAGGAREKIVETALTYLGDPYSLGGSSHDGIDCSGLTMVSYATVGVSLVHYVPSQDAAATPISEGAAQPGDLVFFNDDEHVALYLGGGMIIEAPDYGIPVRIVSLSSWSGIGYHFGRILSS